VLHGGPGAPGYMAPVARRLAKSWRVLEPLQRGSGAEPLSVARHVADLHELLEARFTSSRPALVGHSFGAMLALAYSAAHPGRTLGLALVSCGTFDSVSRARMQATLDQRMDGELRRRIETLAEVHADPDERLRAMVNLTLPLYSYELSSTHLMTVDCDERAHRETWEDMLRLQESGTYPAAFAAIREPVLMLHGTVDPHPGPMIRTSLERHLPQLEYREWRRCGHYPWLEKAVDEEFFSVLNGWLGRRFAQDQPGA